jgi:hypothetical protein
MKREWTHTLGSNKGKVLGEAAALAIDFGEEANAVRWGRRASSDIQERLGTDFQTDHTTGRSSWALQGNNTRILQSHSQY